MIGPSLQLAQGVPAVFLWHNEAEAPMPEGVPILVIEADGGQRIARLDESGYLFDWSSDDSLDPSGIAWWAHIPPAPDFTSESKDAA